MNNRDQGKINFNYFFFLDLPNEVLLLDYFMISLKNLTTFVKWMSNIAKCNMILQNSGKF